MVRGNVKRSVIQRRGCQPNGICSVELYAVKLRVVRDGVAKGSEVNIPRFFVDLLDRVAGVLADLRKWIEQATVDVSQLKMLPSVGFGFPYKSLLVLEKLKGRTVVLPSRLTFGQHRTHGERAAIDGEQVQDVLASIRAVDEQFVPFG